MISFSKLCKKLFSISFNNNEIIIFCNSFEICHACLDNELYILRTYESFTYNTKIFRIEKSTFNKSQKVSNDYETYLWYLRLRHISLDRINKLIKDGLLRELRIGTLTVCESYLEGKMTKRPFSTKGKRAKLPL